MGILGMFGKPNEYKQMIASEKRQINLARETETSRVTVPEDTREVMSQEGKSDLLHWQQDLGGELLELVLSLRGYTVDINGNMTKDKDSEPLCNDKFIVDVVIPQCKAWLSRNMINSTFSEERLLLQLKNTANDITANMADGYDVYGIEFQNYDIVLRLIKNVIMPSAFRALNGFTKKTDSTIFKKVETSYDGGEARKGFSLGNK